MPLQIIQRRDYLHNWATAEAASPPTGNLRRGEIAIAIVTDDGTDTGEIVEVIGRIGPSDTPTPFFDCPVVFRSPRGFKGADVRPVLVDDAPATNAVLAYDSAAGKFVTVDEDPGTYEEVDGTEGGGGSEGGGVELGEIEPTILLVQSSGLATQAVVDTNPTYTLTIEVIGRPDPILSIEIEETAWPDYENNALNFSTSTSYQFSTDDLPQGVSVSVVDSATLGELGARTYTITGLAVNRSTPTSRVAINARIGASNPAGSSPESLYATQGQIAFVEDPATATPEPTLSSVTISEGGSAKSKIANLATGGTATLAASYVATGFTDGVANGTVSYQWYEGDAALVGETAPSVTITNNADRYNDSQVSVEVTISDDNGSDSRRGYIAIGDYDEGFTELVPSDDSRLFYVASDGDDAAAASNQHGRPYYLPSDPEIGPDPINPVGPIRAFADPFEASKYVRASQYSGDRQDGFPNYDNSLPRTNGYPDWMLFRRGQTFATIREFMNPYTNAPSTIGLGQFIGAWNQAKGAIHGHGAEERFTGGPRGRSEAEPMVVTAWGPLSDPRPVFSDAFAVMGSHRVVASIEMPGMGFKQVGEASWLNTDGEMTGLLVEDCKFVRGMGGTNAAVYKNARFRRCVAVDSFNPDGHNSALFVASPYNREYAKEIGWDLTIEECVFDRNGYKEDPHEPTTWTIGMSGAVPAGTGVQPRRTYYDRNLYLSSYTDLKVRGNIISRGGGGSDLQMRVGGVCERNLFVFCAQAAGSGHPQAVSQYWDDFLFTRNVMLHDDIWTPPGGWGSGVTAKGLNTRIVLDDNIAAHFHRYTNGGTEFASFGILPKRDLYEGPASVLFGGITNNVIDHRYGASGTLFNAYYDTSNPEHVRAIHINDNQWSIREEYDHNPNPTGQIVQLSSRRDPLTADIDFGISSGNLYHSDRTDVFSRDTFASHQALGYDTASTFETDFASFKSQAGWSDPDRDIVSYMQAVDPTYVVNEDVYVDDGSNGQKQAVRQKVWEVLAGGSNDAVRVTWAKLAARRYHAFLTFIEKARANRKGAWDSRWTAEPVNNYIREGYGKAAVGGPYTADLSDVTVYLEAYA